MADFYNEQVEEMEFQRSNYRAGGMSDIEAYEKGIIDEFGYEHFDTTNKKKTCRCCQTENLHWASREGKWFLFDDKGLHKCKVNPLKIK